MNVLGIETTCDETSVAIVRDGKEILSNVVSSQVDLHHCFGGVVPELACRRHADIIQDVLDQALKEAGLTLTEIDLIAVAEGPGLIGPLMIGLNAAKALSWSCQIPYIAVNHIEAHLYGAFLSHGEIPFPAIGAILSGGHTSLLYMERLGSYELLGETQDDAIGEAFDKVARLLDLPYPGGPEIEKLAKGGNPLRFPFKPGNVKSAPFDFSFSGLKTAVLYTVKGKTALQSSDYSDLAASFQEVALGDVVDKIKLAAKQRGCCTVILGGGVTCNQRLRELAHEEGIHFFFPSKDLSLDNGAMIAGLGFIKWQESGKGSPLTLEPKTRGIAWQRLDS